MQIANDIDRQDKPYPEKCLKNPEFSGRIKQGLG